MKLAHAFVPFFLLSAAVARGQSTGSDEALKIIAEIRAERNKAMKLGFDSGFQPIPSGLKAGIQVLLKAADRLEQPDIPEKAKVMPQLGAYIQEVFRDLVEFYVQVPDAEGCNQVMRRWLRAIDVSKGEVRKLMVEDALFTYNEWVQVPKIQKLIAENESFRVSYNKMMQSVGFGPVLSGRSFASPYKKNLSEEEKIAGLAQFWAMAKYNFVYLDKLDSDWNKVMVEYTPKVLRTKSTYEYYRVLQSLCAKLQDGHTNVYMPSEDFNNRLGARPPIRLEVAEGKVVVVKVFTPEISAIRKGDVILAVDGMETRKYGETYTLPYACGSTEQDRELRAYSYDLLRGPLKSKVKLKVEHADGKVEDVLLARDGYKDLRPDPQYSFEIRPDGVVYCLFSNCTDPSLVTRLQEDLSKNPDAKGLVIDLRFNGGGNSSVGWDIVAGLANQGFKIPAETFATRLYSPTKLAWGKAQGLEPVGTEETFQPEAKKWFTGPCALLIGTRTFSAAEDWASFWRMAKVGPIIGTLSGGSTGQPLGFPLPGGGSARVCTKRDLMPDGTTFVGVGIKPDLTVPLQISAVRNNVDEQLERAVKEVLGRSRSN